MSKTKPTSAKPEKGSGANLDRRGFLRSVGGASLATTAVAAGSALPAEAAESETDRKKARYRESEHVKNYYRVNRY